MSEGVISNEPIHLNELDLHMSEWVISDEPIHLNESDLPEEIKTVKSACLPVKTSQPSYADFSWGFFTRVSICITYMWPRTTKPVIRVKIETEIHESWINKLYIDVWFVGYDNIWPRYNYLESEGAK